MEQVLVLVAWAGPGGSLSSPGQVWAGLGMVCRFEDEMLKVEKLFAVLMKIKEEFSVKRKIFSVDHYLCRKKQNLSSMVHSK
jgi:hypothetical protein